MKKILLSLVLLVFIATNVLARSGSVSIANNSNYPLFFTIQCKLFNGGKYFEKTEHFNEGSVRTLDVPDDCEHIVVLHLTNIEEDGFTENLLLRRLFYLPVDKCLRMTSDPSGSIHKTEEECPMSA